MTDEKGQQEPSMEEILASIRRIISEDSASPSQADLDAARHPQPADARDILELTQRVDEDGVILSATPDVLMAGLAEEDAKDFSSGDFAQAFPGGSFPEDPFAQQDSFTSDQLPGFEEPEGEIKALLSQESAQMALDAFAALSGMESADPLPLSKEQPSSGDLTVEAMVREALRPALKSWLDEHLPPMVERLVKAEIQRLGGARRR